MVELKLLNYDKIQPRAYQNAIAETASKKNTLVVLPTGMGKTLISILVGLERLEKFPDSKILITAPTRPLNAQHKKSFEKFTTIEPEAIVLITGKINPDEREKIYQKARVIATTPQSIRNDAKAGKLSFENFSSITFDEAHRCIKDYAYTFVAKKYMLQAKHPLILGLTASPGGSAEKINEICKNLFIDAVEIRSEIDEDVEPYVKAVKKEWVYVDLPEEFRSVKAFLDECLRDNLSWLKERNFLKTLRPPKKQLLALQNKIASRCIGGSRNYFLMWVMIRLAEAIKIEHAIELLETQGISPLYQYLKKLESSKKRTDKHLFKDPRMIKAFKAVDGLQTRKLEHPKFEKLKQIVKELVRSNPSIKIIIFANYRFTVDKINKLLEEEGIKSEILIGQATKEGMGLTQEEQIETLKRFAEGEFNVLVATSIGEEGLDVTATNIAIFYEPVPSEIRSLQRRGRVGRQIAGEVIFLITKGTRDEVYYWAGFSKEKKMKKILYKMKENGLKKKKTTLLDWTRNTG